MLKFIESNKDIVVHALNTPIFLKRAKNNGGMVKDTALSVTNALNRVLDWIKLNSNVENDISDYDYVVSKIVIWAQALQDDVIYENVYEIIETEMNGSEKYNKYTAKRKYYNEVMRNLVFDDRFISIIERYTKENSVDNVDDSVVQDARLAPYDVFTACMLFTYTKLYYIAYLTIMDAGEYTSIVSASLFGEGEEKGLADILSEISILHHYPHYIGQVDKKFIDRYVFRYISPYIETKLKTDSVIVDKISVAGVNSVYIHQKVVSEMLTLLHRIVPSGELESSTDSKDDYCREEHDPSDRKFYFKRITRYLSESITRIMENVIRNFKPKYSMKNDTGENGEKDQYDLAVYENKENAEYIEMLKDEMVKDAVASISFGTLTIGNGLNISKHDLGKFMISIYMNIRYGVSDPVNYLTPTEYKSLILHIFDLLSEHEGMYDDLRMALLGRPHTGINNTVVSIEDFDEYGYNGIPPFLSSNLKKSLNILSDLVKKRYITEVVFSNEIINSTSQIKTDLIRFLVNANDVFGW